MPHLRRISQTTSGAKRHQNGADTQLPSGPGAGPPRSAEQPEVPEQAKRIDLHDRARGRGRGCGGCRIRGRGSGRCRCRCRCGGGGRAGRRGSRGSAWGGSGGRRRANQYPGRRRAGSRHTAHAARSRLGVARVRRPRGLRRCAVDGWGRRVLVKRDLCGRPPWTEDQDRRACGQREAGNGRKSLHTQQHLSRFGGWGPSPLTLQEGGLARAPETGLNVSADGKETAQPHALFGRRSEFRETGLRSALRPQPDSDGASSRIAARSGWWWRKRASQRRVADGIGAIPAVVPLPPWGLPHRAGSGAGGADEHALTSGP